MFASKILTLAAAFGTSILASPTPSPEIEDAPVLAKRAEGIHLVNCVTYSVVVYCSNDSNCNHNPTSGNGCIPSGPKNGVGLQIWEDPTSCTFPTDVTFSWSINSNAQSQPNYAVVGSGSNGHGFTIHKDDQHVMYTDGNGHQCKSIYYAI